MDKFVVRLTADQAQANTDRTAAEVAIAHQAQQAARAQAQLQKRGPGRPRLVRDATALLVATAATLSQERSDASTVTAQQPNAKRRKYKNWFSSPYIHDILAAYTRCQHSARATVASLHTAFPRLATERHARFEGLCESTVRSWFDANHQLLPRFQLIIDEGKHPNIHLVFVPANCTSQLQVADVVLQRPFKHGIKRRFNMWATSKIAEQLESGQPIALTAYLKMKLIKPLVLQWCLESWASVKEGRGLIKFGWHDCCVRLYNVKDAKMRQAAAAEVGRGELEARNFVPQGEEVAPEADQDPACSSDDDDKDELDVMKERKYGERKSKRKRKQTQHFGGGVNPSQIDMVESGEDSDADGM